MSAQPLRDSRDSVVSRDSQAEQLDSVHCLNQMEDSRAEVVEHQVVPPAFNNSPMVARPVLAAFPAEQVVATRPVVVDSPELREVDRVADIPEWRKATLEWKKAVEITLAWKAAVIPACREADILAARATSLVVEALSRLREHSTNTL